MKGIKLNVLMIGLDSNLAQDENSAVGNAKDRHIEYAKHLKNLYIVVKTSKNIKRKVNKLKDNLYIYPTSSLNRYFFLYDAYKLASKICKRKRIDLIITQDPFITGLIGWLLKKRFNLPLNIQIAADMIDNQYFIRESIFNLFFNKLAKLLIRKADTIRISSSNQRNNLIKLGVDKEKIHHVPFFINFLPFQEIDGNNIRQLSLNGRFDKIVLSASRLVKQKNIETLIQAIPFVIKEYPKCLFLIVGSGPKEKHLKRLASNLGVSENIKFQGQVSYKDVPRYFCVADIFVITSVYEGTPMVLLEAIASGKPVISTAHAGAFDTIIDGQTGYIVGFRQPKQLGLKLLELLNHPIRAKEMGNQARQFILAKFNKEAILKNYIKMWQETARINKT